MDAMDMISVAQRCVGVSKPVSTLTGSVAELADARALEARFWLRSEGSNPSAPIESDLGSHALQSTEELDKKSTYKSNDIRYNSSIHTRMSQIKNTVCVIARATRGWQINQQNF